MARQQQIPPDLCSFIIPNVRRTGRHLDNGPYCSVEELEFDGLACAGKKPHDPILDSQFVIDRFYNGCRLVSVLRHPNVVQFLGLCILLDARYPFVVMEKMRISLHHLLEIVPDIDFTAKISILQDVARGLLYLHNRDPPIIHRDLSALNILLNSGMVAKIAGFGTSRIMEGGTTTMTRIPGTLVYMPPEALEDPSTYNMSLDMFSFGHLTLFLAIQEFPGSQLPPTYLDTHSGHLIARSEVERRGEYFTKLEVTLDGKHPLVLLTKECLHNVPEKRPTALQALKMLESMFRAAGGPHDDISRLHLQKSLLGHEVRRQEIELQAALFAELKPYTRNVQPTGESLGHGAYGSVVEVKMGKKVLAAKSFRGMSFTNVKSFVHTFCARVMLLFQLSHPNILKYEGICFMSSEDKIPSLLMERMTWSLHSYLLHHENLPIIEKASILHNVSNGLQYLHGQTPAVIHRDLSATNVLLDESRLVAKIADFGNARIIDLNPLVTPQTMTVNPGTPTYMPPEAWEESSENVDKLDIFSFGHLSLFTVVQKCISLLAATYVGKKHLCARSEIERRDKYMKEAEQMLGKKHVLLDIIKKCLDMDVMRRPSAKQLFSVLQNFIDSLPDNQLNMRNLREIIPYLMELSKDQIYSLGLALGLIDNTLEESRDSPLSMYLSHMLKAWLRRQDDVEEVSGPPTWKSLVKALRDVTVRQNGIANKIEEDKLQP